VLRKVLISDMTTDCDMSDMSEVTQTAQSKNLKGMKFLCQVKNKHLHIALIRRR
jgi:hypothetical protein